MQTFVGSTIIFQFQRDLPQHIELLHLIGYPTSLVKKSGPLDRATLDFAFHNPGYDGLEGMVDFKLDVRVDEYDNVNGNDNDISAVGRIRCVIFCGLEWRGNHVEPWAALFTDHDDALGDEGNIIKEIMGHTFLADDTSGPNMFRTIHDIMLREYSDISGNMVQEMMPQSAMLPGGWKLSLVHRRASGDSDFHRKKSKSHLVSIECHKVTQQEGR